MLPLPVTILSMCIIHRAVTCRFSPEHPHKPPLVFMPKGERRAGNLMASWPLKRGGQAAEGDGSSCGLLPAWLTRLLPYACVSHHTDHVGLHLLAGFFHVNVFDDGEGFDCVKQIQRKRRPCPVASPNTLPPC